MSVWIGLGEAGEGFIQNITVESKGSSQLTRLVNDVRLHPVSGQPVTSHHCQDTACVTTMGWRIGVLQFQLTYFLHHILTSYVDTGLSYEVRQKVLPKSIQQLKGILILICHFWLSHGFEEIRSPAVQASNPGLTQKVTPAQAQEALDEVIRVMHESSPRSGSPIIPCVAWDLLS